MKIALPDAEATTALGQAIAPLLASGDIKQSAPASAYVDHRFAKAAKE